MARYWVSWKTTCTWATDLEAESEEEVKLMVAQEGWLPSDCELVNETDHSDFIIERLEEED